MSDCLLWPGKLDKDGYGKFQNGLAHRYMYEKAYGKLAAGIEIDHVCNTRNCVNLAHLEPVTHSEHVKRSVARRTKCRSGHSYAEHGYIDSSGYRRCRLCSRRAYADWKGRH